LRTAFGVNDCGHDIASESGPDLIEQIDVFLACLGVSIVAYFKGCAIRSQTAVESGGNSRTEVAAYRCGTHERNSGLNLLKEIDENRGMGEGSIGIKARILEFVDSIHSIRENLLFYILKIVASHYSLKFDAELVCKLASFSQELKAHIGHLAVFILAIDYKIILVCHFDSDVVDKNPGIYRFAGQHA